MYMIRDGRNIESGAHLTVPYDVARMKTACVRYTKSKDTDKADKDKAKKDGR